MEIFRSVQVYIRNVYAGELSETDEGYLFSYDEKYRKREDASAVSLTMPIRQEPYHLIAILIHTSHVDTTTFAYRFTNIDATVIKIGRASCRERV